MKNKKSNFIFLSFVISISCFINSCRYDKAQPDYKGYPNDIGKIIVTKCAGTGCHNETSKEAAGGLSMETWDKLFEGGRTSASVIPYRHDFSIACYYINTYPDLGFTLKPIMPYNKTPLSHDDVSLVEKWIDAGAPNDKGFVKFSDNANRKKFYVANQGCDVVTVFDTETLLPMRYINIGTSGAIESSHDIQVSPDGKFWYVLFTSGQYFQKFSTETDELVSQAYLGPLQRAWNTFTFSNDGNKAYLIDYDNNADIAVVDLATMTVSHNIGFNNPHGCTVSPDGNFLYVTEQVSSSKIYKIPLTPTPDFSAFTEPNLFSTPPSTSLNSHQVLFSPDGSKYFVTCQGTSEVRVMSSSDVFITAIPVGASPTEMEISESNNLLFVTCEDDISSFPGKRGSLAIIDIATNTQVSWSPIYTGHQPHGIEVDDEKNLVYIANRNVSAGGPSPHHTAVCGGKNGYVTFVDMNTHQLLKTTSGSDKKVEVSVDPYEIGIRH